MTNQTRLFPDSTEERSARIDREIGMLILGHPGGALNMVLNDQERSVLRALRTRIGRANTITIEELRKIVNLDPRTIKGVVRSLRINFHLPVGSSKHTSDGGYYLMVSQEDRALWVATVTEQIRAEAAVVRAAAGKMEAREMLGQLSLEANDDAA